MTLSPRVPAFEHEPHPGHRRSLIHAVWDAWFHTKLKLDEPGVGMPEAWFLGPKAENAELLRELVLAALDSHVGFRRAFHPEDPSHFPPGAERSPAYIEGVSRLRQEAARLFEQLRLSTPFASLRYQGHMVWDQVLPAIAGMFAGMLYNQNNVAAEASPVTTRLEIEVGDDLCRMLGYDVPADRAASPARIAPWGHLTSGGTVANIEALWAARNLKYAAVALREALRDVPALAQGLGLEVPLWDGTRARLADLDTWTLLNLDLDVVAGLPASMAELGVLPETLTDALAGYAVQNTGLLRFYRGFMQDVQEPPVVLAPATGHYSWPKAATLLGLGRSAIWLQRVDCEARLDLDRVEASLSDALRRRIPVICAVAVIGSTEESAVDPVAGLLALRDRFRAHGLNFAVHADAAWGGYFRSMLGEAPSPLPGGEVPIADMSAYVRRQYEALPGADSVTVDPHKGGYVPYPAGALCYRNAAFRDAISLRAPVVFHSQTEPTVGVYGVEGSKSGAAAAAVWLAHRVIRPDRSGYGRILGQCMWTSKRLFCRLATLDDPRFKLTLFNRTPAERAGGGKEALAAERDAIRRLVSLSNAELSALLDRDEAARALFGELGSDQVILAFALNFRDADGAWNRDLARANLLADRVFTLCSVIEPHPEMNAPGSGIDLILTSSRFDPSVYGAPFVEAFCGRMGVQPRDGLGVDFLISTTMDPWTTETERGDFLAVIVEALRRATHRALDELGFG